MSKLRLFWRYFLLLFVFIFETHGITFSQIVINEGSNRNYSTIADEDHDYPDWIELFNSGDAEVNLNDWTLSDNPSNPQKWFFPNIILEPGAFKLVFCSSKDRRPVSAFVNVAYVHDFTATASQWNTHT